MGAAGTGPQEALCGSEGADTALGKGKVTYTRLLSRREGRLVWLECREPEGEWPEVGENLC